MGNRNCIVYKYYRMVRMKGLLLRMTMKLYYFLLRQRRKSPCTCLATPQLRRRKVPLHAEEEESLKIR
ncbi:hypothetical protein PS2_039099 [Malus domestica]